MKHIYDIEDTSLPKTQDIAQFKAQGIKAFRIAQYNKKRIRIVIEATKPMNGNFKIEGRKVTFFLTKSTQTTKQTRKSKKRERQSRKKYRYNPQRKYKTIILDAGHGGRDIGCSTPYLREKDLTLSMALKLRAILRKMGYRVLMTKSYDRFMNLKQRTDYQHHHPASIFISIHANAAPKKRTKGVHYEGIEVFYLGFEHSHRIHRNRVTYHGKKVYSKSAYYRMVSRKKVVKSAKLARAVHHNILAHVSRKYTIYDKGIKRQDFWVLLATTTPSILVETGYLTNKNESRKLQNSAYQTRLMEGIARGVNQFMRSK